MDTYEELVNQPAVLVWNMRADQSSIGISVNIRRNTHIAASIGALINATAAFSDMKGLWKFIDWSKL